MTHATLFLSEHYAGICSGTSDPPFLPPIRPDSVAIVLADCASGFYSPALNALLHAGTPVARARLRETWVRALVDHGVDEDHAAAFVDRAADRIRESLHRTTPKQDFDHTPQTSIKENGYA